MKKCIFLCLCFLTIVNLFADNHTSADESSTDVESLSENKDWGTGFAFGISTGLLGMYAPIHISLLFPKIGDTVTFGIRSSFSITPNRLTDYSGLTVIGQSIPVVVSGSVFMHIGTQLISNIMKFYGGAGTTLWIFFFIYAI